MLERRAFLLGSASVAALAVSGCGGGRCGAEGCDGSMMGFGSPAAANVPAGSALVLAETIDLMDGTSGAIRAAAGNYNLGGGSQAGAFLFNQQWPAPTLRIAPGATLDVTLNNGLAEPTNVHWHGLVAPSAMDGHPMDVVAAGAAKRHTFVVNARPASYWYHPHPHRRTARQAYLGLAGFLCVDDGHDAARGLPTGPRDMTLLMADKRIRDGVLDYSPGMMDAITGWLGNAVLVNGKVAPVATVEPAVLRLRLLNASNARILNPALSDGRMFWLIGTDGGLLDAPRAVSNVLLAPGERVELLLDLSRDAGKSVGLVSAAFAGAGWDMMGGGSGAPAQGAGFELLRFDVTAPLSGGAGTIPTAFEPIVRHDPNLAAQRTRVFELTGMNGMSDGWHRINGLLYDGARIDFSVQRLQLERWQFVNRSDEPHPMHMHGTQFQVLSRSGAALPTDLGWKDTVLVRGQETVQIALRFDVAGQYVLHCHNLEHEDHGMMLNFNVL